MFVTDMIERSILRWGLKFTAFIFTVKMEAHYKQPTFTYYLLYSILNCVSSLFNVKMEEMVQLVEGICEWHQKVTSLAHIFIEREYLLNRNFCQIYHWHFARLFMNTTEQIYTLYDIQIYTLYTIYYIWYRFDIIRSIK